jgi:hypothetical protein
MMPRVKFLADFDFKPTPQVTIAYRAGQTKLVTTPCSEQAIARGKAKAVDAPPAPSPETVKTIARKTRRRKSDA